MQRSPIGFSSIIFFAILAIPLSGIAAAQDMPPILAPPAPAPAVSSLPAPSSPAATAIIPPAAPAKKAQVATAVRPARHPVKSAAVKKRLAAAHTQAHAQTVTHHVAFRQPEPSLPAGMVVPPPGYYAPAPRERLVYGGPPPGLYGGWGGYRGRYPYYP